MPAREPTGFSARIVNVDGNSSRPALSGFTASKALWVSMRWNPIVMPKPQNT